MATWAVELAIWQLGLPEVTGSALGAQRARQRTEFASARKKKTERNSQWHHQTPLLTEKRLQAANRSWIKRQLQAVVIRNFFYRSIAPFKIQAVAAVRLDNAIPIFFC
jgi:hypothetical protein